jgi:putative lipase involved disintegration of autophagic bodies
MAWETDRFCFWLAGCVGASADRECVSDTVKEKAWNSIIYSFYMTTKLDPGLAEDEIRRK